MAKPLDFLTFNDGKCEIGGRTYRFGRRTVSMQRHFAAKTAGVKVDLLIHVPYTQAINADERVQIGNIIYRVEQAQPTRATLPPCTILTLRRYGVNKDGGKI